MAASAAPAAPAAPSAHPRSEFAQHMVETTEDIKDLIAGKQHYKCANRPIIVRDCFRGYLCPFWNRPENKGSFDRSGFELAIIDNNNSEPHALCVSCFNVVKRYNLLAARASHTVSEMANIRGHGHNHAHAHAHAHNRNGSNDDDDNDNNSDSDHRHHRSSKKKKNESDNDSSNDNNEDESDNNEDEGDNDGSSDDDSNANERTDNDDGTDSDNNNNNEMKINRHDDGDQLSIDMLEENLKSVQSVAIQKLATVLDKSFSIAHTITKEELRPDSLSLMEEEIERLNMCEAHFNDSRKNYMRTLNRIKYNPDKILEKMSTRILDILSAKAEFYKDFDAESFDSREKCQLEAVDKIMNIFQFAFPYLVNSELSEKKQLHKVNAEFEILGKCGQLFSAIRKKYLIRIREIKAMLDK